MHRDTTTTNMRSHVMSLNVKKMRYLIVCFGIGLTCHLADRSHSSPDCLTLCPTYHLIYVMYVLAVVRFLQCLMLLILNFALCLMLLIIKFELSALKCDVI